MASRGSMKSTFTGAFSINNILGLDRDRDTTSISREQSDANPRPQSPRQHKCRKLSHQKSPNSRTSSGDNLCHSPKGEPNQDPLRSMRESNYSIEQRLHPSENIEHWAEERSGRYSGPYRVPPRTIHGVGSSDPRICTSITRDATSCKSSGNIQDGVPIPPNVTQRTRDSTEGCFDKDTTVRMVWSSLDIAETTRNTSSPDDSDFSDKFSESEDRLSSEDQDGDYCGSDRKKKKTRTVFSRRQIFELETMFDMKRYLTSAERTRLAHALQMSETQVKIWFQNRRNKWKRHLAENEPQSQYSYAKTDYIIPAIGLQKPMQIQGLIGPQPMYYSDNRLRKCFPVLYGQTPIELTHL